MAGVGEPRTSIAAVPHVSDRIGAFGAAEKALDQADFEGVLKTMPVGVLIEDEGGGTWINPELARIWRSESAEAPRGSVFRQDLLTPGGQERPDQLLRLAFGTSIGASRWRFHLLRRRDDGTTVPVRVMHQALPATDGGVLSATFVVEAPPPEPDARLRKSLLAMIGHELRTPMSSIVVGAELLQSAHLGDATRDEVSALVVEEAHRANILIEQLTALTLLQSLGSTAAEPVHMVHLVRKVGAREARRRPGIHLELPSLDPRGCIALGDEGFVAQALEILVDNAAKYAPPSGEVAVVVEQVAGEVEVHVLDRGPGLQGADPARLFDLYERGKAHVGDGRGTGIGLYVASQIVNAMHGRIWAAERADGGADFGFALPVAT